MRKNTGTNTNTNTATNEEKQSTSIYVKGTLISAMYGKRSFKKGGDKSDKYRISIKPEFDDMMMLRKKAEPYYEDADEQWIPKWLKSDKQEDMEYLNLASNFDIRAGKREDGDKDIEDLGYLMDYISDNGNINGSKVVVLIVIKEGAIYPQAILIKEMNKQSISDMFSALDDELPF